MKLKKKIITSLILLFSPLFLSACASQQTAPDVSGTDEQKQPTVDVSLRQGQLSQSAGLITMPVLLRNTGTNSTVVSSRNFALHIQGHTFKPFSVPNTPADFHEELDSGSTFNDSLSFYLGTTLTPKQLHLVHLTYTMDNGKTKRATSMTASFDQEKTKSDLITNMKQIGDYYTDIKQYMQQVHDAKQQGEDIPSLKDQFQDADYDKFRMWVLINKKDPQNIILQAYNQTNTDIAVPFSDIEIVNKTGDELQVDPAYRNYFLCLPHGKFEIITVPLEGNPSMTQAPFTMKLKQSDDSGTSNNFFSTKSSYYPIETVVTDAKDISTAFSLTPNQYAKGSITWSKPVLNFKDRTFKCTVDLNDIFALRSDRTKYSLVGIDKDGTDGDIEIPKDVEPTKVSSDSPTQINMRFGSLKVLKTYKNIELRYDNQRIMKVK